MLTFRRRRQFVRHRERPSCTVKVHDVFLSSFLINPLQIEEPQVKSIYRVSTCSLLNAYIVNIVLVEDIIPVILL
jgi:hypothetical protein